MKTILAVIAVIIIVGGVGLVVINNKDDSTKNSDNSSQASEPESSSQAESQQPQAANELDPNNYTQGANIGQTLDATDQKEVNVSINDFIFDPTYLKIKKGTKITWTNDGNIAHTVTSDTSSPKGGLDSELLDNGQSYSFTFDEAGVYEYFCQPHPTQMKAVITVVE